MNTNCVALLQQKFILSQFWRLGVQNQSVGGATLPLKALLGGAFLASSYSFLMLAVLRVPWLLDASLQSLPL